MTLPPENAPDRRAHSDGLDQAPADVEASWAEEIHRRIDQIRNGTAGADLLEVIAELDRYEAEFSAVPQDEEDESVDDPAETEAAWAEEIADRLKELGEGTVKTYAAEDVMAVLWARFGRDEHVTA